MWTQLVVLLTVTTASWGDVVTPTPTASLLMKRLADSVAEEGATTSTTQKSAAVSRPEMYSLHVKSDIEHRFATTLITSRLANPAAVSQEIFFSVIIPETAFISKFLMEVKGKVYEAYVREKEVAKQEYDAAVAAGQGAAHVALSARDSNRFTVSVNIEPMSKVTFNLTYEELLTRRLGAYNHVINLDPGQVVRDLKVDVYIKESRNLTLLRVPELRSGNEVDADEHSKTNPLAGISRTSPQTAHISFSPTAEQQQELGKIKPVGGDVEEAHGDVDAQGGLKQKDEGIGGQFVVQYDVDRDPQGGEVLVNNGFFVHFFAPKDLPPLRKHALFVLDVSGSMEGRKIDQLKEAMDAILDDLNPGDYFNIIEFSYSVTVWNLDSTSASAVFSPYNSYHYDAPAPNPGPTPAFPATPEYIAKAKEIVKKMRAGGGTNIYDTLKTVIRVAHTGLENITASDNATLRQPIIVFLTDGEPTVGETRLNKIFGVVQELNVNPQAAVFSLAFGDDADLGFLKTLSLRNAGFARKIYEASDAALQLRDFYRQIASPLLTNVTFDYVPEKVVKESTTKIKFHTLFSGAELVVAGKLRTDKPDTTRFDEVVGEVHGLSSAGESTLTLPTPIDLDIVLVPRPPQDPTSLERLWAYLTIKQLLEKEDVDASADDVTDKDKKNETDVVVSAKKQALELALKYSFVTPLTSLVVVKPNETLNSSQSVDPVDGTKDGGFDNRYGGGSAGFSASFASGPVDRISSGIPLAFAGPPGLQALHMQPRPMASPMMPHQYQTTTYRPSLAGQGSAAAAAGGGSGSGNPAVQLASYESSDEEMLQVEFEEKLQEMTTLMTTQQMPPMLISLDELMWLKDARNGSDVILPFGANNSNIVYHLQVDNETLVQGEACSTTDGSQGHCVHLLRCSLELFQHDIHTYKPYFCDIHGYAGACCPSDLVKLPTTAAAPSTSTPAVPTTPTPAPADPTTHP